MNRSSHCKRSACARWAALVAVAAVVVVMAVWVERPATATERVRAAEFTVTNLDDSGDGSLRQVIDAANATVEADTITFAPNVTGTIELLSTLPFITTDVTIEGPGATILTISGKGAGFRVFRINSGGSVTISGLTISNGNDGVWGGGILNFGRLTLTDSLLSGNSATFDGGGIYNDGTATITNSTLSNNTASNGGGIYNRGTLTITNSTLSGNSATNNGGGIFNGSTKTTKISNSTLSNNSASGGDGGGGIFIDFRTTVTIKNLIVANSPVGGNCFVFGTLISADITAGVNLATDNTCAGVLTVFKQVTTAALNLGPLNLNSPGTIPTHALLPGSAAIDKISVTECTDVDSNPVTTDQRGVTRPQGPACDVGAFEVEGATPAGMIEALVETIVGFDPPLHHGTANSLMAKLNNALAELEAGDTAEARALIGAFINQVAAQAGKKISQAQADELIAAANAILAALE